MIITDEMRERAARLRQEAGLPPTIADPSVLAAVQAKMRAVVPLTSGEES